MTNFITIKTLRELDALVAEQVLGIDVFRANGEHYENMPGNELIAEYSSDIATNLRIKLYCLAKNIQPRKIEYIGERQVKMDDPSEDKLDKAIVHCLLALRNVGTEVDWKVTSDHI